MKIPKHFNLHNHTIRVSVIGQREWDALSEDYDMEDAVGIWQPKHQVIVILRQSKSMMLHTYLHELTHAILDTMNEPLSNNEKFVDTFSGLLAQAIDSADK